MIARVVTSITISDTDPTRCGAGCRHSELVSCRLFGASCLGTPEDAGAEPVRCPECLAATERSPAPARCWPEGEQ